MDGDLTRGNPAKVIIIYALPIILGNVFQQLYNVVDLIIVGRFISYQALAGVGITNGLTFFILGFVMGITSGMAIRTAQLVGAGDLNGMRRSVATSLLLCLASCVVLTVFSVLLARPLLRLIGTGEEIFGFASTYLCRCPRLGGRRPASAGSLLQGAAETEALHFMILSRGVRFQDP